MFGGKIIAALDRQHPRDLFDIKFLIDEKGINDAIKPGFMLCLLSSNRPILELLNPIWKDQRQDFEETRETMILQVRSLLSDMDKKFLLSFKRLDPNWAVFDFEDFPAVKWKMKNLRLFKEKNEAGYNLTVKKLEDHFSL